MTIKVVLFDLDGVLVDTCKLHYVALNKALLEIAGEQAVISRVEHECFFNGLPTNTKLGMLATQGRLDISKKDEIYCTKQQYTLESIRETVFRRPEKIEMLQKLVNNRGIRVACVTNCSEITANPLLKFTGILDYFKFYITNEMVRNPKPNSEGYVKAMVMLQSEPEQTLIIEDSPKGLTAARNTGANVLEAPNCDAVCWDFIKDYLC